MPSNDLILAPGTGRAQSQSPQAIRAQGHARVSFARVVVGGIVLGLLAVGYVIALFNKLDAAHDILLVIGSGLGFLLGSGRDKPSDGSN